MYREQKGFQENEFNDLSAATGLKRIEL